MVQRADGRVPNSFVFGRAELFQKSNALRYGRRAPTFPDGENYDGTEPFALRSSASSPEDSLPSHRGLRRRKVDRKHPAARLRRTHRKPDRIDIARYNRCPGTALPELVRPGTLAHVGASGRDVTRGREIRTAPNEAPMLSTPRFSRLGVLVVKVRGGVGGHDRVGPLGGS